MSKASEKNADFRRTTETDIKEMKADIAKILQAVLGKWNQIDI